MSERTIQPPAAPARRERGLGYALAGGLGITLVAILIGVALSAWFLLSQRGASAPELLPADTQLYATLAPSLSDVPEARRIAAALRESFGLEGAAELAVPVEGLLGVSIGDDVVTWLGGDMAVAVRGVDQRAIAATDPATSLLANGEVLFILGSRNDPQAAVFLRKHLEARANRGERVAEIQAGAVTVYLSESGPPSPIAAVALIEHYIIFANRAEPLVAIATRSAVDAGSLAGVPAFASFSQALTPRQAGDLYSDGSAGAEAARAAIRQLIAGLGE